MYPTQQPERREPQNTEQWPTENRPDTVFRTPVPDDTLGTGSTDDVYAGAGSLPGQTSAFDPWNFPADSGLPSAQDIIGYHVEATDGRIGKVEEMHGAANGSFLVVDTGPWIFGRKVMLPAGLVTHVDHVDRNVYVDRTKDEIKNSPEVDADNYTDVAHRDKVESYYATNYGFPPGGTAR